MRPRTSTEPISKMAATVKRVRLQMGMTQQQFAIMHGLSVNSVARWEARRVPAPNMLLMLADTATKAGLLDEAAYFREVAEGKALVLSTKNPIVGLLVDLQRRIERIEQQREGA